MKSRYAVLLVVLGCFLCGGSALANICKTCPPPQVRTLYTFDGNAYPTGLVQDARGNFYGVDAAGGLNGCGAVFQLSNSNYFHMWGRTDIYQSQSDINTLNATLVFDQAGAIYGTSLFSHSGGGTVFKLTNNRGSWSESIVYQFASYADSPTGGLLFDPYIRRYFSRIRERSC